MLTSRPQRTHTMTPGDRFPRNCPSEQFLEKDELGPGAMQVNPLVHKRMPGYLREEKHQVFTFSWQNIRNVRI